MNGRALASVALALSLLPGASASAAQRQAKVFRIGYLSSGSIAASPHLLEAFRQGLREAGYVEGQDFSLELRASEGNADRLPGLAAELVRLQPDVIVTTGTLAPLAVKQATRTIPIVLAVAGDPVGSGLVASLARPGGNITGLSILAPELGGKRLQLLKEALPALSRVAVLWNPANPLNRAVWAETEAAARVLGLQLQSLEVRGPDEFAGAFEAAARGRPGALAAVEDPLILAQRTQVVAFAAKRRLPAMYGLREFVDAGGLMALGVHLPDLFRRAAAYVDKILKGAKPADLPVEQPTRFEFVINLKTAKVLGLTIPQSVLIRADQVIQ